MKKRRKLKKKFVVLMVLIFILIVLVTGLILYVKFHKKPDVVIEAKVVNEIKEYGYVLENNKTELYKDLFDKLVDVLKEEKVDEEEYAKIISQMAVIDFYNLDNKTSKNDIGGTQFIREENVSNFVLQASETVYKYVEQNLDGNRQQVLPVVKAVEATNIKTGKYSYKGVKDDKAYTVTVKLEYKKDLGYPKEVVVKLLHNDKKLEIYYMK